MNDPKGPPQVGDLRTACQSLGFSVAEADANTPNDIPGALAALANENVDVVIVLQTNLLLVRCEQIGAITLESGYRPSSDIASTLFTAASSATELICAGVIVASAIL